ncbi:zinc finger BED domain-containing protein 4-like [Oratosquilla oratoria]|uniref:zinc finger BED domain-containing protein 4-like n=1 Tax=Oratosquilla oratoria TaxID=337810 RepID=UPI003F76A9E9
MNRPIFVKTSGRPSRGIPHINVLVSLEANSSSDNAANMAAAAVKAHYESLPCFLHTLQLSINDAIFTQKYVKDILSICKQIVGHFNHSPAAFAKYQEYQKRFNLPDHKFIQDIQTRWNSHYYMMSRVFEQKSALISYCSDHAKPHCLESNQWKILERMLKVLKHYLKDKNLILATYLDPRFKTTFLESNYQGMPNEEVIAVWITEESQDICTVTEGNFDASPEIPQGIDSSDVSEEKNDNESDFTFSFEKCFSELKKKGQEKMELTPDKGCDNANSKTRNKRISKEHEMSKYISLKNIENNENPLQWWRLNENEFPIMALFARKYLPAPPSSVESEKKSTER